MPDPGDETLLLDDILALSETATEPDEGVLYSAGLIRGESAPVSSGDDVALVSPHLAQARSALPPPRVDISNGVEYDAYLSNPTGTWTTESGVVFTPDGLTAVTGTHTGFGDDYLSAFELATAWDIDSFTGNIDDQGGFSFDTRDGRGIAFGDDGHLVHIVAPPNVYMIELTTAYDITSMSLPESSYSHSEVGGGIAWNDDGTKFTTAGMSEYECKTPYDVTTASYITSNNLTSDRGVFWGPNGRSLLTLATEPAGTEGWQIVNYTCSTPYDITTAANPQNAHIEYSSSDPYQHIGVSGLYLNPDSDRFYYEAQVYDSTGQGGPTNSQPQIRQYNIL